ncbi:hypothetical protein RHMOL_Rhmol03G0149600 [Rhododendron molle]|uniref:Uncharacterized protein n=1 Tax=Rhododendron molle TaxID=49168 RepID=A0ACC0PG20_RHOML|nr:hypothetical protein RHMOL_Rhmol03G0149600 [Rhododendron molle]
MFDAVEAVMKPLFREMLVSGTRRPPVTCVIGNGILGFTIDVAKEIGMPVICLRTISPCFLWIIFCLPKLIEAGEIPFKANSSETEGCYLGNGNRHQMLGRCTFCFLREGQGHLFMELFDWYANVLLRFWHAESQSLCICSYIGEDKRLNYLKISSGYFFGTGIYRVDRFGEDLVRDPQKSLPELLCDSSVDGSSSFPLMFENCQK